MKPQRLLTRLRRGDRENVRFGDARHLAEKLGFVLDGTEGSHQVFRHPSHPGIGLPLQERKGKAKGYQLRQLLELVERYNLEVED